MNNQDKLQKTVTELSMLYDISNAVFSTLELDEILYIILTCLTAKQGLGFNRAMLFMVDEKQTMLEGKMGIGPHTGEEGRHIWEKIEHEGKEFEDFIKAYEQLKTEKKWPLNKIVCSIKIPLSQTEDIISMTYLEGMPFEVNTPLRHSKVNNDLKEKLRLDNFVCVPLKGRRRNLGVILVDNFITKKPIVSDDIKMMMMFISQAGLAIENSQLYEEVLRLANTDSLTKLWNHGHFQHVLSQGIATASKEHYPVSLLMIDIDYFKTYNDTLGHPAGDRILQTLSQVLTEYFRPEDIVCRYGGEEFSIILPQTDKEKTIEIAEKLRQKIEAYPFENQDVQPYHTLTVSMGVSAYPDPAKDKKELMYQADMALYQAKRGGRNRVRAWRA